MMSLEMTLMSSNVLNGICTEQKFHSTYSKVHIIRN
uniref:Uncharacterized protein n=1 Tax=Rhizophora mucronata TaxID=61149 RepID=A0A2P2PFG9_RHIMU